jgi:hypothetical protein
MLLPDGRAHLSGELAVPSGYTSGSNICQLPPAYTPGHDQCIYGVGFGTAPILAMTRIDTTGIVHCYGALAAGNTFRLNGAYPLNT